MVNPKPVPFSTFSREFFMNGGDGIVIAFSLATGLHAANTGINILFISLMVILTGGVILGLGAYYAGKIEIKHFFTEMQPAFQQMEDEKEIKLLQNIGLGEQFQTMALQEIEKDRSNWAKIIKDVGANELTPDFKAPAKRGFFVCIAFITGGLLPLVPYFFTEETTLIISMIITLIGLAFVGFKKNSLTGGTVFGNIISAILTGVLAGLGAYYIAGIFA